MAEQSTSDNPPSSSMLVVADRSIFPENFMSFVVQFPRLDLSTNAGPDDVKSTEDGGTPAEKLGDGAQVKGDEEQLGKSGKEPDRETSQENTSPEGPNTLRRSTRRKPGPAKRFDEEYGEKGPIPKEQLEHMKEWKPIEPERLADILETRRFVEEEMARRKAAKDEIDSKTCNLYEVKPYEFLDIADLEDFLEQSEKEQAEEDDPQDSLNFEQLEYNQVYFQSPIDQQELMNLIDSY
ncbi:unnamed protein product [Caenorhabditis sp. 36 PRJEB53466]|nr:unnamed protein product [Caenorhabditis sp. 36 PRJEB53466]